MDGRSEEDYWFALKKESAKIDSDTYWLDGNPSTYRWWCCDKFCEPNEEVECVRYTHCGFRDRKCSEKYQYTCKMAAGIISTPRALGS